MQFITDLDITYNNTLAEHGFHKILWNNGSVNDLMGNTGRKVYIWSKIGSFNGIKIINIFKENEIPNEYVKVNKPLMTKNDINYYLCYSKFNNELSEITAIKISLDDDIVEDYIKIDSPLTEYIDSDNNIHKTYLWYSCTDFIELSPSPREINLKLPFKEHEFVEYQENSYYYHPKISYGIITKIDSKFVFFIYIQGNYKKF